MIFWELLIDKDLYHLEELEVQAEKLEDRILSGQLDEGSAAMTQPAKRGYGMVSLLLAVG